MMQKWFQLVGDDGKALTSVSRVTLPDNALVVDLQDAVFEKDSRALPADVVASDLIVFANSVALDPRASLVGIDEKEAFVVVVPKQFRRDITTDKPRVDWKIAPEPCPRLIVKDEDQLIELPPSYVSGTGIDATRPDQALILYRRPPLVKQWSEMNRCSIRTYALLWVVGPPGTGKSCAALAFAWSLKQSHWDVIWIHYSRVKERFNCVLLRGNQKAVCVVDEDNIKRDLAAILESTSQTKKTIVFLDGYVTSSAAAKAARHECLRWHQKDKFKHRLVCVCSMVAVGKDYRSDLYGRIPANVDEEPRDSEMEDVEMSAGELHNLEEVHTQMLFKLTSWRFDDYKMAVLNDDFFRHVEAMFPPYPTQSDPEKEAMERIKLLQEKYFVVGGSARHMFEVSTADATKTLTEAFDVVPDMEPYLKGFVGDSSSGAVNRLLARYDAPLGYDIRLVSEYVVRHFATVMGPHLVQKFARACNVNPSMDGFILEAWFFAELSHNGLAWSVRVGGEVERRNWERSSIVFFDPDRYPLGVSLDVRTWMAPSKWNQGGYDAVFIDKAAQLVRFVQVTRANSHTFDAEYFVEHLDRLVAGDLNQVAVVELCFVVPMARRDTFELPVSKEDFKRCVVEVASSPLRATRSHPDQAFKGCSANVMVIGVDYEITDHYRVEGSQVG